MARGRHRVYVGPAPGAGATAAVLAEARRRAARGTDVVVGVVEVHGQEPTDEVLEGLEVLPRTRPTPRGALEEMDLDGLLARHPHVVVVDELAHTNAPGSRHGTRWQDVDELLDAGIDVISTLDVHDLGSLVDPVSPSTGTEQRGTLPDDVVRRADEIELVDLSPAVLREQALSWLADRVEDDPGPDRTAEGIESSGPTRPTTERVVVALSGGPEGEVLLRRGARIASRGAGGELLTVHVARADGLGGPPPPALAALRLLTEELGGTWHSVRGDDPAEAILDIARAVHASHVVIGSTRRPRWRTIVVPSTAEQVIRRSGDIDVHVVMPSSSTGHGWRASRAALRRRRARLGYAAALVGPPVLTALLTLLPQQPALPLVTPLYLLPAVLVAFLGGVLPALVGVVTSSLLLTWFLAPPLHTLTISHRDDAVALVLFVVLAVVLATVVHVSERRAEHAVAAQHESAALAELTHTLLRSPDPMHLLLERAVDVFGARQAQVVRRATADAPSAVVAESDLGVPQATWTDGTRSDDETHAAADHAHDLVLVGVRVPADSQRLLEAFATHAAVILQRRALQKAAAAAVVRDPRGPAVAGQRPSDAGQSPARQVEASTTE